MERYREACSYFPVVRKVEKTERVSGAAVR
jgi:hypothetical protein